jgi:hypothetical protein
VRRGILIEPAATNLVKSSQDITSADWTTIQLASVFANQSGAPDGTSTTNLQIPNGTNSFHELASTIGNVSFASGTYTYSIYAKPSGYNFLGTNLSDSGSFNQYVQALYDVSGGSLSTTANLTWTISATSIQTITTNSWFRTVITAVTTTTGTNINILVANASPSVAYSGNGSGLSSWGAQLETGSTATSYIATTTGSTASRSADVATFTQPAGCGHNTYTFDDNSTQTQTNAPGTITIPTNLNRPWIKTITGAV